MQSRLEGRLLSASDFAGSDLPDEANGRSVDSDDMSDGGSTVDLENGNGHSEQGSAAAWWSVAPTRFSNAEVRSSTILVPVFALDAPLRMISSSVMVLHPTL